MKYFFYTAFLFLCLVTACQEDERFISNFDNEAFLKAKTFLDTNANKRDSALIKSIGTLYDKMQSPCVNDTTLFNTYWEYWDGNTDAFCGSYSYYMKRRLGYPPIKKGEVMPTMQMYGILSANIEKSIPQFIKHIDSSLKLTYFKAIKSPTQINVSLDIKLNHCKISTIYIKANNEIDKHFINELYRIIYISPKWILDELPATKEEYKSGCYVRDKNIKMNVVIDNNGVELLNYAVDSIACFN
jgi:hypothetical protein